MKKLTTRIACLFVAILPAAPVMAFQQTAVTPHQRTTANKKPNNSRRIVSQAFTANQKKWLELEPIIDKYRRDRADVAAELSKTLIDALLKLDSQMDGRAFAREILGLHNMHQIFGSEPEVRAFVHNSFERHVLDVNDVERALIQFLHEYDAKMADLDNQFLIDCQLDVDFDPASIRKSRVRLDGVRQELRRVSADLDKTVSQAFTHHLIAGAAGIAGGELGNVLGNELGRDANGNETLEGQLLGMLFGVAAGFIAEEATASAMGTEVDIANRAKVAGQTIIRNQLLQNENFSPAWLTALKDTTRVHDQVCLNTLVSVLGPHPNAATKPAK